MSALIRLTPATTYTQVVDDGSEAAIGKQATSTILKLIQQNIKDSADPKLTVLRRSKGSIICGSVNVKNKQGLYLGERSFVVDLARARFGRDPEGPELLDPHTPGFAEKEQIRQLYFQMCLN